MKIAVVGAGSFTFGPSMLSQTIIENRLSGIELALVDVDAETLDLMAGVARRMAKEADVDVTITTHTDRRSAFAGAEFVVCSAAVQMQKRFKMDYDIIQHYLPGHLMTEFGGIAGISNSLRQIALIQQIAADIRESCPDAWLLNVANPLPRVCQAAHESGVRTVGFCSVGIVGYSLLWRLFYGEDSHYPFTQPRERWSMLTAGLNHFTWVLQLQDRQTGEDLLPEIQRLIAEGKTSGNAQIEMICKETGYFLAPGDDHIRDFVQPRVAHEVVTHPWHGTPDERQQRLKLLKAIGDGDVSWEGILQKPSWERPIDFIVAYKQGKSTYFPALNLINARQMPELPDTVYVETPVTIEDGLIKPKVVNVPDSVLEMTRQTARLTDIIVQAGMTRSREQVHEAVLLDPTVLDKDAGLQAIDACLEAQSDLLSEYA